MTTIYKLITTIIFTHCITDNTSAYGFKVTKVYSHPEGYISTETAVDTLVCRPTDSILRDCRKQFLQLAQQGGEIATRRFDDFVWCRVQLTETFGEE